jgi:hypothetical protein
MLDASSSSLRVGEDVVLTRDLLAEIARSTPGAPHAWRFVAAGTRGRLIGFRDRPDRSDAVVDVAGEERRLVVFVQEAHVAPAVARS